VSGEKYLPTPKVQLVTFLLILQKVIFYQQETTSHVLDQDNTNNIHCLAKGECLFLIHNAKWNLIQGVLPYMVSACHSWYINSKKLNFIFKLFCIDPKGFMILATFGCVLAAHLRKRTTNTNDANDIKNTSHG